ncbi:MAG: hypothetical protein K8T10_17935 [Candidatus Eremiobacteraeota bacterium]|nr:hypothetical protein [Candidatus Eremiobacteraeota bacterium]
MENCLMTLMVGGEGEGEDGRGIRPNLFLFFCGGKEPRWIRKDLGLQEKDKDESDKTIIADVIHYPHNDQMPYVLTDLLLRFCPQISASYDKIRELFDKIESSTSMSIDDYFQNYKGMKHHKESRRILALCRETFEDSKILSKIVMHVLIGGPKIQIVDNLKRMNAPFELGITEKYRLKGKGGIEEVL